MKNLIIIVAVVILVGLGAYWFMGGWQRDAGIVDIKRDQGTTTDVTKTPGNGQTAVVSPVVQNKVETVIGKSVEGRDITAYHYGTGDKEILLVGGVHGGYSWNTALVAYEIMDYLKANPGTVPGNIKVTVIPVLNPDGLYKVVGATAGFTKADVSPSQAVQVSGRFNANDVDLNRNFDCEWQKTGMWQSKTVSGGSAAFSEPESVALKNYVEAHRPAAAVVFFSSAGGVFSSSCGGGILAATTALTNLYAKAAGYPAYKSFDFYATTGDMVNWLAKKEIPAISILLTNHTDTEWTKNWAGIKAALDYYAK